ncbi:MAG: glycosyl transferase [Actinomycetota bacterium]|nr:glycosyl transferase [Actinomycetota bacterium]
MRPGLLFYCQHSLGLGHLARSLRIAAGLAQRFDVLLLNGGRFPDGTAVPAGVEVVNLPPLGHDADYRLVSHHPELSVEQARKGRRRMLLDILDETSPAVVIVEMYPFGRKKFEFELIPLLDAIRTGGPGRPTVVCSLRDILVNQRTDQSGYDERVCRRANRYFDAVLVHADPAFARLEDSFRPRTPLAVPVHYTGFVAPPPGAALSAGPALDRLLVSSGGGMVGEPLVRAAVEAHAAVYQRTGLSTTVVAGPFLPDSVWTWLQARAESAPQLEAVRRVDDLCLAMGRSKVSLSQGGYNTTMDILRAATPAVVVPFSEGAEDEQRRRTQRLQALGLVRLLPPEQLSTESLVAAIIGATSALRPTVALDLDGAAATADLVAGLAGIDHPPRSWTCDQFSGRNRVTAP